MVLQASAAPGEVAVFLFREGVFRGAEFRNQGSGVRDQGSDSQENCNRRSFDSAPSAATDGAALRMTSEPLELKDLIADETVLAPVKLSRAELESRLESLIAALSVPAPSNATLRQGHLALLKRWYYRPEARRAGEIFFPDAEGRWPIRAILRGIGRVAASAKPE